MKYLLALALLFVNVGAAYAGDAPPNPGPDPTDPQPINGCYYINDFNVFCL